MVIAVASGKGGTGKTTFSVSLASVVDNSVYLDCDVEEPNGHLYLNPIIEKHIPVNKKIPVIDNDKCISCGECANVCEYNALIDLKTEVLLIENLCHGCGACSYFCPENAITEIDKPIGIIRKGNPGDKNIDFIDGTLNIGEETATPVIKNVISEIVSGKFNVIDAPPGTSCSMVEAVKNSDYTILVTESTPFGLNDLKLAINVLKILGIPFGVVINKYDPSFKDTEEYLTEMGIKILMKIPNRREIAEAYSKGIIPSLHWKELQDEFVLIPDLIRNELNRKRFE